MSALLTKLRRELRAVAIPEKAPQMQKYMKSTMPYHGVTVPVARKLVRQVVPNSAFSSYETWREGVLGIWRDAKYREERYCALNMAGDRRAAEFQLLKSMGIYEEMIVTGAWWDYVDDIASHRVGPILESNPTSMKRKMIRWSRGRDMWKRRTAILCQLSFKGRTDLDLLYQCIESSMDSEEFFLQKAIGWALREYAWFDAKEIIRYVKANRNDLSVLSKREALKNVKKSGLISKIP